MKNIHLIPTNKGRIYLHKGKLHDHQKTMHIPDGNQLPQNIYITSDEEIISFNEINSLPLSDGKDIQINMSNI